jgi:ubiquinone/menaquinone biosynthesis C-methylase UbiE
MPLGYEFFSSFYDLSIEWTYRPYRAQIADALQLAPTDRVLDLACGTGQNFDEVVPRIPSGELVGLDLSPGMLARARARVARNGWTNVTLLEQDATTLDDRFDAVLVTLGLSAIGPWREVFAHTYGLLRPGGRFVIFDVHAKRWVPQTSCVSWIAGADLDRKVWEPLHEVAEHTSLEWLPGSPHVHGGSLLLASGVKPAPLERLLAQLAPLVEAFNTADLPFVPPHQVPGATIELADALVLLIQTDNGGGPHTSHPVERRIEVRSAGDTLVVSDDAAPHTADELVAWVGAELDAIIGGFPSLDLGG